MAALARGAPWFMLLIVQSGSLAVHEYRQHAASLLEAQLGRAALRIPSNKSGAESDPFETSPADLTQNIADALAEEIGTYTEYPQWLIICNTFENFDANSDEKLSRAEFDELLSYLGESWTDEDTNYRLSLMDVLNTDQLLQRSEFDFWFTWATPASNADLNELIETYKEAEAAKKVYQSLIHKLPEKENATEQVEWMHLGKALPTAAQISGVFGGVGQYSLMMKLQFYVKMFDFDWSYALDRSEFGFLYNLVDATATAAQVDQVFAELDIQTADGVVDYAELPFMFSPSFLLTLRAMNIV